MDADNDGVPDAEDAFPNDAGETADSDMDGVGDNADAFPNDANESADSDMDGVGDSADAFPNDANESADSDMDGVGDNADAFPNDANESADSDGDGVGNNADPFPEHSTDPVAGQALYNSALACAGCHGAEGEGASSPAVATDKWDQVTLAEYIHANMPVLIGSPADCVDDCAWDIAAYILTLPKVATAPEFDVANGQALYSSLSCAACHGAEGQGASSPAVATSKWEQESLAEYIHGNMPVLIGSPSDCVDQCAQDVAGYILTLPKVD